MNNLKNILSCKYLLTILASFTFFGAFAQEFFISGTIVDIDDFPLFGTTISLLDLKDSSLINVTNTDINGNFILNKVKSGKVIVKVSYIGYNNYFTTKQIINDPLILEPIVLQQKTLLLNEVSIQENINTAKIIGDTVQYDAGALKTNPDANAEDLILKMPGVNIQDGKVQAQGEELKKVLVDGKPFFGDDPNATLKNIPAEMIDKVQIFDGKTDQSLFTGFDDGNSIKTMNIITKTQFRDGVFGKIFGGLGNSYRYKGGFNLNFFKQNRRITLLCNSNNINEQNFSAEDLQSVQSASSNNPNRSPSGRSGGGSGRSGRNGMQTEENNFLVDQKSGINTTQAFGINYTNKWKKIELTSSYFINYIDNKSINEKIRQNFSTESTGIRYEEDNNLKSTNLNHRINSKLEWKIDSLNSFSFQLKFSYQQTSGNNFIDGNNFETFNLLSNSISKITSGMKACNLNTPILYKHSFSKKGRTLSLSASPGYNYFIADGTLFSIISSSNDSIPSEPIDQFSSLNKPGYSLSSNISYTEPLNKNSQFLFSITNSQNQIISNKETNNQFDNFEVILDSALSNIFKTNYSTNNYGLTYSYSRPRWNFSTGIFYQYSSLKNSQTFPFLLKLSRTFTSILPNASIQIKFSDSKNLRFNYRTSNNAPSVEQLQNVISNTNPLFLILGNPNLDQNWQNNGFIRYSSSNTKKNTSFFAV